MSARRPRAPLGPVLLLVLGLLAGACTAGPPPGDALAIGVVPAECSPSRARALADAGVAWVVLDVAWDRWSPAPGTRDDGYAASVRTRLDTCRDRGLRVALAPGLQYAPAWVGELPAGRFREQGGGEPADGPVNLVFSAAVRAAAADYLRDLLAHLDPAAVSALRVGTSAAGELGYPGPTDGPSESSSGWWAFDEAAQRGVGLAAGLRPAPLAGWRPGEETWNGAPVAVEAARAWFLWYAGALADAVRAQVEAAAAAGFRGDVHVVVAGRGTSPRELDAAARSRLGGAGDPQGSLQRGLYYPAQFADLDAALSPSLRARGGRLVADLTGLDDASAVRARGLRPPTDTCRPEDTARVLEAADVESWPSYRFTAAVARRHGWGLVGENPGPPGALTGGRAGADPLTEQLRRAPQYARGCGLETFFVAFEDDLFGPEPPARLRDLVTAATAG